MKIQTLSAVISDYDRDSILPYWLPEGCIVLSTTRTGSDEDLKHYEAIYDCNYTTTSEAIAHFGLKVKTHTEASIKALLLRNDTAVIAACSRLESLHTAKCAITENARYEHTISPKEMPAALNLALANITFITNMANQKETQKAYDDHRSTQLANHHA
jgi:hypothetical protein